MRMLRNGYLLSLLTLVMVVFAVGCEVNGGNNSIITPTPERPNENPEDGPSVDPGTKDDGMTIEISVTDISAYSAMLTVTPSTDDRYACIFISSAQWPGLDGQEAVDFVIDYFDPAFFNGEYSEELQPLMPETEYMVIAFGYEKGAATTELFTYTFTSLKAQVGSVEILDIKLLKLFDIGEIAAIDSSYEEYVEVCECIGIVEATTSKPCDTLWFWWYEEWMKVEGYSEAAFIEDLLMYDYANNPEVMDMYYSMDDSDRFFFAGLANDENGATSDLYIGESFLLSKDMCSPAEEFLAMVKTESNAVVMFARR